MPQWSATAWMAASRAARARAVRGRDDLTMYKSSRKAIRVSPCSVQAGSRTLPSVMLPQRVQRRGERVALLAPLPLPDFSVVPPQLYAAVKHAGEGEGLRGHLAQLGQEGFPRHRVVGAATVQRDQDRIAVLGECDPHVSCECIRARPRLSANWYGRVVSSNTVAHCLARVRDTRRRNASPVAMPRVLRRQACTKPLKRAMASAVWISGGM